MLYGYQGSHQANYNGKIPETLLWLVVEHDLAVSKLSFCMTVCK